MYMTIHKYMHMYNSRMRLLLFSWFSMKLGMINSFLIVCFTMIQKIFRSEKKITKFLQKYHVMAIKQYLGKMHYFNNKYKWEFSNYFPAVSID